MCYLIMNWCIKLEKKFKSNKQNMEKQTEKMSFSAICFVFLFYSKLWKSWIARIYFIIVFIITYFLVNQFFSLRDEKASIFRWRNWEKNHKNVHFFKHNYFTDKIPFFGWAIGRFVNHLYNYFTILSIFWLWIIS